MEAAAKTAETQIRQAQAAVARAAAQHERWKSEHARITELADIEETATGATFKLRGSDRELGTGTLTFVTSTVSGPDPAAAGFARHVRIELDATAAERIQLASTCDDTEHLIGLGGQSFDLDHRGETVPLWVQEDGIGKYADDDDNYARPLAGALQLSARPDC